MVRTGLALAEVTAVGVSAGDVVQARHLRRRTFVDVVRTSCSVEVRRTGTRELVDAVHTGCVVLTWRRHTFIYVLNTNPQTHILQCVLWMQCINT